jgi:thiamine biosynthesis protein ThiS
MKVNGTQIPMEKSMNLEEYLIKEGYVLTRVAVELNGEIVSKSKYNQTFLTHEDVMEVVNFVGGG